MSQLSSSTPPARIWLFLVLLLYAALWFLYPQEFIASDPGAYSARAFSIVQHFNFGNGDVFNQRLGVTLPVAFLYSILGVNILTTNLWPLCAALTVVITVWLALPDYKSKIIGALLCLTSIPLFQSSIALYPDIIATAFMASSSLLLFNRGRHTQNQRTWILAPLGAVLFLFLAFLAKESAYWVLPLWALALFSDLKDKDRGILLRRFYLPAFVIGIVLGIAYLVFCDITWGNPLARFSSIQALTGQHLWSWDRAPAGELARRLTTAPAILFLSQYGAPTLLLAIVGLFIAPQTIKPWGYYVIFCVLFFWFGSTSFTRYEPMPLVDRMTLPLLPAFYVLAAFTLSHISINFDTTKSLNPFFPIFLVLLFAGLPFSMYVQSWRGAEVPEATAMTMLRNDVKRHPQKQYLLVCSDTRSPQSLSFYFGYQYPKNLDVVFAGDLTNELLRADEKVVFIDKQRSRFLQAAYGRRHYDQEIHTLGLALIYKLGPIEFFKSTQQNQLEKLLSPNINLENKKE